MFRHLVIITAMIIMGAYVSIINSVDYWEGRHCWGLGNAGYARLPFGVALQNTWQDLLMQAKRPEITLLIILQEFSFAVPTLAVAVSNRPITVILGFLLVASSFGFNIYEQYAIGFDVYCDEHGDTGLADLIIQLFFVMQPGLILLLIANLKIFRVVLCTILFCVLLCGILPGTSSLMLMPYFFLPILAWISTEILSLFARQKGSTG